MSHVCPPMPPHATLCCVTFGKIHYNLQYSAQQAQLESLWVDLIGGHVWEKESQTWYYAHTVQRLWSYMHRDCTHQYTDRNISHTLPHSRTLTYTHPVIHSLEIWCHIFVLTLEWVDTMLSAELLEILRDGVCGRETFGIVRQVQSCLKCSEAKLILFTVVVLFMHRDEMW